MIVEREIIGIKTQENKDNGTIYTSIYCAQEFTEKKGTIGRECTVVKTTQTCNFLVGDIIKVYYDSRQVWDKSVGKFVDKPIVAEIVKVS